MKERMPVIFVSHGAPDALLKAPDSVVCWEQLGRTRPKAILAVSAHWEERRPTASLAERPETIHDFSGFQRELYSLQYLAPGSPVLAKRAASLLFSAGIVADLDKKRGLDHGAWVPLKAMHPEADLPVAQLSLVQNAGAVTHFEIGKALSPLRDEGVLILCSGAITHNFSWLDWRADLKAAPHQKAEAFSNWVAEKLAEKNLQALLKYRSAPYGAESHPTEEHFMPLFVAIGAAGGEAPRRCQPDFTYGALSMDAYIWG